MLPIAHTTRMLESNHLSIGIIEILLQTSQTLSMRLFKSTIYYCIFNKDLICLMKNPLLVLEISIELNAGM